MGSSTSYQSRKKWIGVDFDGTLAFDDGIEPYDPNNIGEPIPAMLTRVKDWIAQGEDVRIVTARVFPSSLTKEQPPVSTIDQKALVEKWCTKYVGKILPVQFYKDPDMRELWDDRAVQVVKNTGERVGNVQRKEGKTA